MGLAHPVPGLAAAAWAGVYVRARVTETPVFIEANARRAPLRAARD